MCRNKFCLQSFFFWFFAAVVSEIYVAFYVFSSQPWTMNEEENEPIGTIGNDNEDSS